MYRTLTALVAALDFFVKLAERLVVAADKLQGAAIDKAADLDNKAADIRYEANERALEAAYDAVERAEQRLVQQLKDHKTEVAAIGAAHG